MPAKMEAPATIRARKAVMWTRDDCRKIEAAGLMPDRWELVEGEIISRMGTRVPRSMIVSRMLFWLSDTFAKDFVLPFCGIDVHPDDNPINEPAPDLTVLNSPSRELELDRNPGPSEIALLVEVSDATLDFDLGPKARLYARAGIPENWALDIHARVVY